MAREILEKTELNSEESIIYLDVKTLYTIVPLKKAVEIALRRLYEQVNLPETSRNTGYFVAQKLRTCIKKVPKVTVLNEGNKEVCPGCQKKVLKG